MAKYLDGFVFVVPQDKVEDYKKMAEEGAEAWMKHGALQYFECKGDDLTPKDNGGGKPRAFDEMTGAGSDDTVWFSFIVFKDKAHRDEVNAKVMAEMDEKYADLKDFQMPMDTSKMAYGGFEAIVEK